MTTGRINQVAIPSEPTQPKRDEHATQVTLRNPKRLPVQVRGTKRARSPKCPTAEQVGVPWPRITPQVDVAPIPKGNGAPQAASTQSKGSRGTQRLSSRVAGARKGLESARARPPRMSLEEVVRRAASRFRLAPKGLPLRRGAWHTFVLPDSHGRDRTSASDGVGTIPPHSLAFRPECNPSAATALRVAPIPWARRRRASEGTGNTIEGNGADLAELDSRGEWWLTAGVASREKVTGSDSSRCAMARVSAQDQPSASATNEGDGLHGDNISSQR